MFLGKSNKMWVKKGAAAFALALLLEAFFMPSLASRFAHWAPVTHQTEAERSYVLNVLRENRTGLGSLEELKLAEVILMESVAHRIDPLFVLALIKTESTYYNWSKSLNGAMGLMQILPSTGRELAEELDLRWEGDRTLLDPYANVKMGVHYLSSLQRRYKDVGVSLAAYNMGPGRVDSRLEEGAEPGQGFASRVLTNYKMLKQRAEYY